MKNGKPFPVFGASQAAQLDYLERWPSLEGDMAKVKYLVMLKERAQTLRDQEAHKALLMLTQSWLQEPYQP